MVSVPTLWRTVNEIATGGSETLVGVSAAVHVAWCGAWAAAGAVPGGCVGCGSRTRVRRGVGRIRLDAAVISARWDEELAEPSFTGFGCHRVLSYCDDTGEPPAGMPRCGGGGSNTVGGHLTVVQGSIAALPPEHRRRLMVSWDGAGAGRGLIAGLDALAARSGYELVCSVGWGRGARGRGDHRVPEGAGRVAIDHHGVLRERRTQDACQNLRGAHAQCRREAAHGYRADRAAPKGPGRGPAHRPGGMRVVARRERPHPGARLSLSEAGDGCATRSCTPPPG